MTDPTDPTDPTERADDGEAIPWLDPDRPHEDDRDAAQVAEILELAVRGDAASASILDLGCGGGRLLAPLVAAGHAVVGLDRDPDALARAAAVLADLGGDAVSRAELVHADFDDEAAWPDGPFDLVLLVGNTLLTIVDPLAAVALLERIRRRLAPGGRVVLDDVAADFWPEVAEGRWTSGISEDGAMQLAWEPDDAVFALRTGDEVDPAREVPGPGDRRFRLWTRGLVRLAGRTAGFDEPGPGLGGPASTVIVFAARG